MDNVNLNSLRIFLEVANSKSFLSASNKLFISQPAISKSISKLEEDLGVKLFFRANKGITLTESGEILLSHIRETKSILDACERELISLNGTDDGTIIIGVRYHLVRNYLMDKISDFSKKYPKIKIILIDNSTRDMIDKLQDRKLDLIIDSSPVESIYNNLTIKKIGNIDTCFIKSSMNNCIINNINDLSKHKLILPAKWGSLRKDLDKVCDKKNITLNTLMDFETEELIIDAVRKNLGIGFVLRPAMDYLKEANIIEIIDIKEKLPEIELNLIYIEKNLNKVTKLFIDEAINN